MTSLDSNIIFERYLDYAYRIVKATNFAQRFPSSYWSKLNFLMANAKKLALRIYLGVSKNEVKGAEEDLTR